MKERGVLAKIEMFEDLGCLPFKRSPFCNKLQVWTLLLRIVFVRSRRFQVITGEWLECKTSSRPINGWQPMSNTSANRDSTQWRTTGQN